jgi:hypothetical protein
MKQTAVEWLKNELIKRFKRSQSHQTDSEWSFDMIKKVSEKANELFEQQIEKMYSEEDLQEAFYAHNQSWLDYERWFEQFKKK